MEVLKEWVGVVFMQGKSSLFGTGVLHVFSQRGPELGVKCLSSFQLLQAALRSIALAEGSPKSSESNFAPEGFCEMHFMLNYMEFTIVNSIALQRSCIFIGGDSGPRQETVLYSRC